MGSYLVYSNKQQEKKCFLGKTSFVSLNFMHNIHEMKKLQLNKFFVCLLSCCCQFKF